MEHVTGKTTHIINHEKANKFLRFSLKCQSKFVGDIKIKSLNNNDNNNKTAYYCHYYYIFKLRYDISHKFSL